MSVSAISDKRKALLAYKEKLLQDIKYYESRISDEQFDNSRSCFVDGDSSDSDSDLIPQFDAGPSLAELKHQQSMLKTCLEATQELTMLRIVEYEANVMVDDPVVEGSPVQEEGMWREVMAECVVDLVHFSMSFYVHKPTRKFGPLTFRSLRVSLAKRHHEAELSRSVLPALARPADATEVVRSYAGAYRSRRASLARLAHSFAGDLTMEPMPEGGYILKCANLLELQWSLQNKWSPIAPFHHRLKFDLEYMDESYVKTISAAHRQLSEPDVDTDERTNLLALIISTCLEASRAQEQTESMSSDADTANRLEKRRTTLDTEPEVPPMKKKKDADVMAPPRTVPKKKVKKSVKNDVNDVEEKRNRESLKRISEEPGNQIVKKVKTNANTAANSEDITEERNKDSDNIASAKKANVVSEKNSKTKQKESKTDRIHNEDDNDFAEKNIVRKEVQEKNAITKNKKKKVTEKAQKVAENENDKVELKDSNNPENVNQNEKKIKKKNKGDEQSQKKKDVANVETAKQKKTQIDNKTSQVVKEKDNTNAKANQKVNKDKINKNIDENKADADKETTNNVASKDIEGNKIQKVNVANKQSEETQNVKKKKVVSNETDQTNKIQKDNTVKEKEQTKKVKNSNLASKEIQQSNKVQKDNAIKETEQTKKIKNSNVASKQTESTNKVNKDLPAKKSTNITEKTIKNINEKSTKDAKILKKVSSDTDLRKNLVQNIKKVASDTQLVQKKTTNNINYQKPVKPLGITKEKNIASGKNIKPTNGANNLEKVKNIATKEKAKEISSKATLKPVNKPKLPMSSHIGSSGKTTNTKTSGNTEKENIGSNSKIVKSKLHINEMLKKLPLRSSPRTMSKVASKIKPGSPRLAKKPGFKPTTNIPRLIPKTKAV